MNYKEVAKKWAIYYRSKYDNLSIGSIVSKIIAEIPEVKPKIKEIIPEIKEIVEEISKISKEDALKYLKEKYPDMLDRRKEQREGLPQLPNAEKGKVKTRFAPNPSGYLHIGHARAIIISHEYAKMYGGKFVLRLEDTDPKVKKPVLDAYEKIPEDVEWLIGEKLDEFYIQSERLNVYYEYAKKLIEKGYAYVDLSPPEIIREYRSKGIATEYRDKSIEWHLDQWEKMLEGVYDEGQAVLRIKTDLNHPNPSVRDWIAFRIVNPNKNPHPWLIERYGMDYAKSIWVWPTYNFSVSIDDHLMGITHVFRMKEHEVNSIKQKYIYDYFGWTFPTVINYGAVIVEGLPFHKSEIKKLLDEGKIKDLCDPFLANLCSLRNRGILPQAIRKYIIEIGINPVDVKLNWDKIFRYNRELIDKKTKRLFFVKNPIKVIINNLPENIKIRIKNHPETDLGYREYRINQKIFYLEKEDVINNKYLRLMEAFNIEIIKVSEDNAEAKYIDNSLQTAKELQAKIVQWVNEEYKKYTTIQKPNNNVDKGYIEMYIDNIEIGEPIHLIRYGFVKKTKENLIWMHK